MTARNRADLEMSETMYEHHEGSSESLLEVHHRLLGNRPRSWRFYALHIGCLLLNALLSVILISGIIRQKDDFSLHNSSPAKGEVEYRTTYFDKYGHLHSPFSKKPGPELDNAWHNQLDGMNIRVSEDWLEPFGAKSIRLTDGSGVIAQLGFYHELHCLKRIKHWIYRSHYYSNDSAIDVDEEEAHIEHCLEWLRVAALCHGDTTLTTFQWRRNGDFALETEYPIARQCVDSKRLMKWSKQRAVDITQEDLLVKDGV